MISLLNRIARGIEDAWTAGLIQLFMIAILSYGVASGVVNDLDTARMQAEVEHEYNVKNKTDIHIAVKSPSLSRELWDNGLQLTAITFIVAYEIRRRIKRRSQ